MRHNPFAVFISFFGRCLFVIRSLLTPDVYLVLLSVLASWAASYVERKLTIPSIACIYYVIDYLYGDNRQTGEQWTPKSFTSRTVRNIKPIYGTRR